jgi:hypothetical protein
MSGVKREDIALARWTRGLVTVEKFSNNPFYEVRCGTQWLRVEEQLLKDLSEVLHTIIVEQVANSWKPLESDPVQLKLPLEGFPLE